MRESADDILYSRVRLAIVAELLRAEWVSFTELQNSTGVTRGNLASHVSKLMSSGMIQEDKRIAEGRPLTRYRLTPAGRRAFLQHMRYLQQVFEAVKRDHAEADAAAALTQPHKRKKSEKVTV